MAAQPPMPRTIQAIFDDYLARRSAIIAALTVDFQEFYSKCDPDKTNLCLYAYPDSRWEVVEPSPEIPPNIPDPVLGINYVRDWMPRKKWIIMVAMHSDAWLMSVSTFFMGRFIRHNRRQLYDQILELPSVFDIIDQVLLGGRGCVSPSNDARKAQLPGNTQATSRRASRGDDANNIVLTGDMGTKPGDQTFTEHGEDQGAESFCAACGLRYVRDEFWIFCDFCQRWYHGKCVSITPARAIRIKRYCCPSCKGTSWRPPRPR